MQPTGLLFALGACSLFFSFAVLSQPTDASSLLGHGQQTTLRFCYQDKPLPPYYLHSGPVPGNNPGASIEHLQQLVQAVPGLQLQLIRLPWKRCLAALETGEVDALIASYQPERRRFARFPLRDGKPDPSRAFAAHATCFVSRPDATWRWDGAQILGIDKLVVARPYGYAPIKLTKPDSVLMHYTLSGTMDLQLLQAGRVQAVTSLCEIAGKDIQSYNITNRGLVMVRPPISYNTGFLVFSQPFYLEQQALAEALWQQLKVNKAEAIYHKYIDLNYQAEQQDEPAQPSFSRQK